MEAIIEEEPSKQFQFSTIPTWLNWILAILISLKFSGITGVYIRTNVLKNFFGDAVEFHVSWERSTFEKVCKLVRLWIWVDKKEKKIWVNSFHRLIRIIINYIKTSIKKGFLMFLIDIFSHMILLRLIFHHDRSCTTTQKLNSSLMGFSRFT